MKRTLLVAAIFSAALIAAVIAQTLPTGVQKMTSMGGITGSSQRAA